ncbi:MAG: flavin reductase family protein [Anaerolineae bacterium]
MDLEAKKKALRMITYGLYVLTAKRGDQVNGATVTWLSQASFEPPLVMVGLRRDSLIHDMVEESGAFAVNVLGEGQEDVAETFFRTAKVEGDRISGFSFESGETGAPLLLDAPAFFECRVVEVVKRGDHTVFVGEVIAAGVRREAEPLVLADTPWTYGG